MGRALGFSEGSWKATCHVIGGLPPASAAFVDFNSTRLLVQPHPPQFPQDTKLLQKPTPPPQWGSCLAARGQVGPVGRDSLAAPHRDLKSVPLVGPKPCLPWCWWNSRPSPGPLQGLGIWWTLGPSLGEHLIAASGSLGG